MEEIVIENLYKSFDTKDGTVEALKNVNLSIESGDIYGIIGMSGAGKSTLVRCINFLEVPTKGRVLINGKSLGDYTSRELRKQREDIGMIFQHFNLLMQKNVLENVCFPLYIQGKSKKDAKKRAKELLDIVGLGDRPEHFRHSCPVDKSRELRLREHWHLIQRFFFVMRQPAHLIHRQHLLF